MLESEEFANPCSNMFDKISPLQVSDPYRSRYSKRLVITEFSVKRLRKDRRWKDRSDNFTGPKHAAETPREIGQRESNRAKNRTNVSPADAGDVGEFNSMQTRSADYQFLSDALI